MFDARDLLNVLFHGNAQPPAGEPIPSGQAATGLADLLKSLLPAASGNLASKEDNGTPSGGGQSASQGQRQQPSSPGAARGDGPTGGLADMVAKLQQIAGQNGGLTAVLGQVLGQATAGVKEGAGRLDETIGISKQARDAIGQVTGRSPDEIIAQIKSLIANNQLGSVAALGALGAVILGTGAGRSLAGSAIKLGGLTLVSGLAYKAYQNYQQGQPALTGAAPQVQQPLQAAPVGSGFEPTSVTHEQAQRFIRAMIAAAAADGRIDEAEQQKIVTSLAQSGLSGSALQFLSHDLNHPATVDELAAGVGSPAEALQVYTAARLAIADDAAQEHVFLAALAQRLGLAANLVAHIDAAARNAKA